MKRGVIDPRIRGSDLESIKSFQELFTWPHIQSLCPPSFLSLFFLSSENSFKTFKELVFCRTFFFGERNEIDGWICGMGLQWMGCANAFDSYLTLMSGSLYHFKFYFIYYCLKSLYSTILTKALYKNIYTFNYILIIIIIILVLLTFTNL